MTKLDLATYYDAIADVMLPHLRGRPVNMQRFPDGIDGDGVLREEGALALPGLGAHGRGAHRGRDAAAGGRRRPPAAWSTWPSRPASRRTRGCARDEGPRAARPAGLRPRPVRRRPGQGTARDPAGGRAARRPRASRRTSRRPARAATTCWCRSAPALGLRRGPRLRPAPAREVLVEKEPDLLTLEQRKAKRGDRVYVDIGRNAYGQTAVPAYAVRAAPGAPVSTPITWDELSRVKPGQFTHHVRTTAAGPPRRARGPTYAGTPRGSPERWKEALTSSTPVSRSKSSLRLARSRLVSSAVGSRPGTAYSSSTLTRIQFRSLPPIRVRVEREGAARACGRPARTAGGRARARAGGSRAGRGRCPRRPWSAPGRRRLGASLEVEVLHLVVLDLDGEPLGLRVERRPLGHRPRHQHAVHLEPQVEVERGRVVAVDHESQGFGRGHGTSSLPP